LKFLDLFRSSNPLAKNLQKNLEKKGRDLQKEMRDLGTILQGFFRTIVG
jgi:hypothetical protein